MKVQEFLRKLSLDALKAAYGIETTVHESEPLVILNYSQIESPKTEPIVQECRALTLNMNDWSVVGRSFQRFFNLGEHIEHTQNFNWNEFEAFSKEDGSLMVMYHFNGTWRVNTRGSFAKGKIVEGGPTWEELFWKLVDRQTVENNLNRNFSYVFEMCSPYNKIVRRYEQPQVYLLAIFSNESGFEWPNAVTRDMARFLGVQTPQVYEFTSADDVKDFLNAKDIEPTFEGFVLRDDGGLRIKVKNALYVKLHQMRGNDGNLFLAKNLLPWILKGEEAELLTYFPEIGARLDEVKAIVDAEHVRLMDAWESCKHIESQKEFAQAVLPKTKLAHILFEARKRSVCPKTLWLESEDRILKIIPKAA